MVPTCIGPRIWRHHSTLESVAVGPLTRLALARQRLECVRFIAALAADGLLEA